MQPARVLLVEDDVHTRRINSLALRAEGFSVDEAVNGSEALRLANESAPDLVIMDISLPGISGIETMIRMRDQLASPPLMLVLTARAMRDDMEAARAAGCDAYLTKPIDPIDLVSRVADLLATRERA